VPLTVLKEIFGFDSFRPGQEEVIRAVLDGRDTLAVMPTGGGKSLCYQVPALMQESLTVIVSPLISLMKDQVDSLLQSSVTGAATLHSGLSPEERWEVERRVRTGEIRMLYVAPERLRSLEFVLSLRRAGVAGGCGALRGGRGALHLGVGPRLPARLPVLAARRARSGQPAGAGADRDR